MKLQHLLVPTDLSENSRHAIDAALELTRLSGGRMTLLHVVEPVVAPVGEPLAGEMLPTTLPDLVERRRVSEDELARLRACYDPAAPLTLQVIEGVGWNAICETAKEQAADLIVITSHGYTGLKRILLGSTAERIVRHAHCPVLVIKSSLIKDA